MILNPLIQWAFHFMNVSDKENIIDNEKAFLFMIWLDKLRAVYCEEYWAYNNELLLHI
jgi:hypothetical protein